MFSLEGRTKYSSCRGSKNSPGSPAKPLWSLVGGRAPAMLCSRSSEMRTERGLVVEWHMLI